MPNFGQLSDLLGATTDVLGALTFFTGSLAGEGGVGDLVDALSSISAD